MERERRWRLQLPGGARMTVNTTTEQESTSARADQRPDPESRQGPAEPAEKPVQLATDGVGPLMQRDYVLVVEGSELRPEAALQLLLRDFPAYSPDRLACFTYPPDTEPPLDLDDAMDVAIVGNPLTAVRVCDLTPCSLTLRTLQRHIEAGRITFAADRDLAGRLVLRIRSRARIGDPFRLVGYLAMGVHIQTRIWIVFLERWAAAIGGRMVGPVIHEFDRVQESLADRGAREAPTLPHAA